MSDSNVIVLKGLTLSQIVQEQSDRMTLRTSCGRSFLFYHSQDCCESVNIDQIEGDLGDLIGSPLIEVSEDISRENPPGFFRDYQDSYTHTTFTFATEKGRVVVRWYGESNGYYSEAVSFFETTHGEPRW